MYDFTYMGTYLFISLYYVYIWFFSIVLLSDILIIVCDMIFFTFCCFFVIYLMHCLVEIKRVVQNTCIVLSITEVFENKKYIVLKVDQTYCMWLFTFYALGRHGQEAKQFLAVSVVSMLVFNLYYARQCGFNSHTGTFLCLL